MMPTHHIHISTGFAFVVLLFLFSAVGGFLWYRVAMKRAGQPKAPESRARPQFRDFGPTSGVRQPPRYAPPRSASPYRSAPSSYSAPSAPSPSGFTAGEGFIGGLVVGNMMGASEGHHYAAPSSDPSPSYDGGSSSSGSDSGFSYDSGSSASSGDSGSSGGFDMSW